MKHFNKFTFFSGNWSRSVRLWLSHYHFISCWVILRVTWHLAVGIWHKNVVSSNSTQHICFQRFKVKTLTSHEEKIKEQKVIWWPLISFFNYFIIFILFYYHNLHSYITYGDLGILSVPPPPPPPPPFSSQKPTNLFGPLFEKRKFYLF